MSDPFIAALEITECGLCDDEGYRGGTVCDHVDRGEIAKRGIAKCREALARAKGNR